MLWNDQDSYRWALGLVDRYAGDEYYRIRIADALKEQAEKAHEWLTGMVGGGRGPAWAWPTIVAQFGSDGIREVDWLDLADRLIADHAEGA